MTTKREDAILLVKEVTMGYVIAALVGGLATLFGLRGCEKVIEQTTGVPKPTPTNIPENFNIIKNSVILALGVLVVLVGIYIYKKSN